MQYFTLLILCSTGLNAFSQTTDEDRIKNLIATETQAWVQKSIAEVVKDYWILDEKTFMNVTLENGIQLHLDKAALLAHTTKTATEPTTVEKSEHVIHINGDLAYDSHEQVLTMTQSGKRVYSHEVRVLEKVNDTWKIHASSVHRFIH